MYRGPGYRGSTTRADAVWNDVPFELTGPQNLRMALMLNITRTPQSYKAVTTGGCRMAGWEGLAFAHREG